MAKGNREKIKLVSSAGTGHYYTATKNKKLHPEKLETKKYDPIRKIPAHCRGYFFAR